MITLKNIEFHLSPDCKDSMYRQKGETVSKKLSELDINFNKSILSQFESQFPGAYRRVVEIYKNTPNPIFMAVKRLVKCNCGEFDTILDFDENGIIHPEYVRCPLRDECFDEGTICLPERETGLLPREKEVAILVSKGKSNEEIAQILFISLATVKTHIANSMSKLELPNRTALGVFVSRFVTT